MTFSLKHTNRLNEYKICESVLQRLSTVKNLGGSLDQELASTDHNDSIISSLFKASGFVIRNSKNFQYCLTLLCLYFLFVRSLFVFGITHATLKLKKYKRIILKFGFNLERDFSWNDLCQFSLFRA
jgi:hypothetical protein